MATKSAKKKATKKAATTKSNGDATTGTKSDGTTDKRTDPTARRGRGALEGLVQDVTNDYEAGKLKVEGPLTPHRIATIIGEKPSEDKPSGGAVAAILNRWNENGYALLEESPMAFKRLSAKGKKEGLEALKEKHREKKLAERRAEREAAKSN